MPQDNFAALQLAHLQNIIEQRQQVVCRYAHFLPVAVYQLPVIRVRGINLQQADNAIQRRSDVVAHAGKEAGFRRIGAVCLLNGHAELLILVL